jgi:cytohesin
MSQMKQVCSILLFIVLLLVGSELWGRLFSRPVRLRDAVERGDLQKVQQLAADPNAYLRVTKRDRAPLLHIATGEGHTKVVEWLLKNGAQPSLKDTRGSTVLMYALNLWRTNAQRGPLMEMLLKAGADPDAGDQDGYSAIIRATMHGDEVALKAMLPYSEQPNGTNNIGATALHYADKPEVFRVLVDADWDPNVKNKYGETAAEMIASRAKLWAR